MRHYEKIRTLNKIIKGASAGAGSGEFDIYRGCRRRENIRQEFLQAQADKVINSNFFFLIQIIIL